MWGLRHARDGWAIEDGQYERTRGGQAKGLPSWYLKRPPLMRGDEFYLRGFWELSGSRRFVGGSIPWEVIEEYAHVHRLDSEMREVFRAVIRELDSTYLEWSTEERRREQESRRGR